MKTKSGKPQARGKSDSFGKLHRGKIWLLTHGQPQRLTVRTIQDQLLPELNFEPMATMKSEVLS